MNFIRTTFLFIALLVSFGQVEFATGQVLVPMKRSDIIGKKLLDFKLKNLKGEVIKLSDFMGKPLVINLWFTACKPCISEIPELNRIKAMKKYSSVSFVAITFDDENKVSKFLTTKRFDFYHLVDAMHYCTKLTMDYPVNIFVDKNGKVIDILDGMPIIGDGDQIELTGNEKVDSKDFIKALNRIL